jgi:hypothetical protein
MNIFFAEDEYAAILRSSQASYSFPTLNVLTKIVLTTTQQLPLPQADLHSPEVILRVQGNGAYINS